MKMIDYLWQNRLTMREFCNSINLSESHFSSILHGRRFPRPKMALKIEEATKGKVLAEDFLYEAMLNYKKVKLNGKE